MNKDTLDSLAMAILRFIRIGGASIISFALLSLAGMAQTAEIVLVTAILVALDKYFREQGYYFATARAQARR